MPVLELDNGTRIADIVAICRYFEELYPEPRLMGRTAEEKAVIDAWQRRIERDGFYAAMEVFRNSTPGLKGRALPGSENYDQIPSLADAAARAFSISLPGRARLEESEFLWPAVYNCGHHRTGHCRFLWLDQAQATRASNPFASLAYSSFRVSEH